MSEYKDNE